MALVTAGRTTSSQTTLTLGNFSDANANGFQSWHWVPLMSNGPAGGGHAERSANAESDGAAGKRDGESERALLHVCAVQCGRSVFISATVSAGTVSIKIPTQSGHSYTVYYSTSLNPTSWQTLASGIAERWDG